MDFDCTDRVHESWPLRKSRLTRLNLALSWSSEVKHGTSSRPTINRREPPPRDALWNPSKTYAKALSLIEYRLPFLGSKAASSSRESPNYYGSLLGARVHARHSPLGVRSLVTLSQISGTTHESLSREPSPRWGNVRVSQKLLCYGDGGLHTEVRPAWGSRPRRDLDCRPARSRASS